MMSLRAIPLIVIALIAYNALVLLGGDKSPDDILSVPVSEIPMVRATWVFRRGDVVLLLVLVLLFVELLKSTYTATHSLVNHALSMLVFVVCLIEFLMVKQAASSVFFFITVAALIDVIAGYTISVRMARRDLQIGNE
jgi:hypothetical protein